MAEDVVVNEKKSKGKGWIVFLLILALGLIGLNVFQFLSNKKATETQTELLGKKETELQTTIKELEDIKTKLETTQKKFKALGTTNTALEEQIANLEKDISYAKRRPNISRRKLRDLKEKVTQYTTMLKTQEAEIIALKEQLAIQDTMITDLKVEKVAMKDTITTQIKAIDALEETVEKSKLLSAHDFKITAVNKKGKEKFATIYKGKKLYKVKVDFTIGAHTTADIEAKDVYVQIIDPAGKTIYDLQQGGGEMQLADGSSKFYTIKKNISYTRSAQTLTVDYIRGTTYEPGTHKVNIFADGKAIGSGQFKVK